MASQVDKRTMIRWLLAHGFAEARGRRSSHRKFVHAGTGIAIVLLGHGPQDITQKHVGMIMRELERAGFDRVTVRRELAAL